MAPNLLLLLWLITDKLIKGVTATVDDKSVTITGEGTDVAVDFIAGNSKLTANIVAEQKYVAPVDEQKGKATLTITSGVDGKALDTATISAKASADEVAKALAEAVNTSGDFTVTYNGNVITVEQKTAADAKMALTIVDKN